VNAAFAVISAALERSKLNCPEFGASVIKTFLHPTRVERTRAEGPEFVEWACRRTAEIEKNWRKLIPQNDLWPDGLAVTSHENSAQLMDNKLKVKSQPKRRLARSCPLSTKSRGASIRAAALKKTTLSPLAAALQPFVDTHVVAGAVGLVATKDKLLDLATVGYADIGAKKPMRADSFFWVASMTKPVTATALMMLVDEGKVSVDDPVEKYLPEFKGQWVAVARDEHHVLLKKPKHPITVRQIMSHTSGLPGSSPLEKTLDCLPLREAAGIYAMLPLQSEPGANYFYTNEGINTAGRIIEVVSGMSYGGFVSKRVLDPLGMNDTTYWPTREQIGRLAKSYRFNEQETGLLETPLSCFTQPLSDRNRHANPGGGLFSSARDYCAFGRMILAGGVIRGKRYVSEASLRAMTTKQTGVLKDNYGLGWITERSIDGTFGHTGAYGTRFWIDPKRGLVMVLLVQQASFWDAKRTEKINSAFLEAARAL
jgi:CubicO group peptidase (beta-lactamase class C family)